LLVGVATVTTGGWLAAVGALCVVTFVASVPVLIGAVAGLVAVGQMWILLARHPWQTYGCTSMYIGEGAVGPVKLTAKDPRQQTDHHLLFQASRRRDTLRGMILREVWIAGDPAKRGVLVMAGGGELFVAHRDRLWYRSQLATARRAARRAARPPKPAKPAKPAKVRQLSPKAKARADAAVAAQAKARARAQARTTARINARQARIQAGRSLLPGRRQRVLGPRNSGGGIFKRK
jgi:hypothetical protein